MHYAVGPAGTAGARLAASFGRRGERLGARRRNCVLGAELLSLGWVYRYRGVVTFGSAIVTWRTTDSDVELIVDVVRGLGARTRVMAAR
jgi:hypothetical protein